MSLRTLAKILTANIREVDFVARVGGDEFLVLAPATPLEGTRVLAERIRRRRRKNLQTSPHGRSSTNRSPVAFRRVPNCHQIEKTSWRLAASRLFPEAELSGRNRFIVREWCRDEVVGVWLAKPEDCFGVYLEQQPRDMPQGDNRRTKSRYKFMGLNGQSDANENRSDVSAYSIPSWMRLTARENHHSCFFHIRQTPSEVADYGGRKVGVDVTRFL
jgi:hypothetical protein